jgi:uncharacterized protein YegP (UPF0339 family)
MAARREIGGKWRQSAKKENSAGWRHRLKAKNGEISESAAKNSTEPAKSKIAEISATEANGEMA